MISDPTSTPSFPITASWKAVLCVIGAVAALQSAPSRVQAPFHVVDASGRTIPFSIRAASNTTIARLGEGQLGGWIQLANTSGYATVEAGTHPKGVGIIRAFPVGSPGGGMVGMPGTFLPGRLGS